MIINEMTRVIARLHPDYDKKGLNIYNPYFEQAQVNAIYLLFRTQSLDYALRGLVDLNLPGAIPAGFEKSPNLLTSMNTLDPLAAKVGKIGVIVQRDGKLCGHYQPGYGLLHAITEQTGIKDKIVTILGASHVAHGLIERMILEGQLPREIHLFNRTLSKAQALAEIYPNLITKVGDLADVKHEEADMFVNTTYIGSKSNKGEVYEFSDEFVSGFDFIADVAFVPLHSQLIETARRMNKPFSPGWKMFVHQGAYCLRQILDIDVNTELLSQLAYEDFSKNW